MQRIYTAVLEENNSCKTLRIKHSSATSIYFSLFPVISSCPSEYICFQALKITNVFSHIGFAENEQV